MQIKLNGQFETILNTKTVHDLVVKLDLTGKRCAILLNNVVITRAAYPDTIIHPNDVIEVVHAIGGG